MSAAQYREKHSSIVAANARTRARPIASLGKKPRSGYFRLSASTMAGTPTIGTDDDSSRSTRYGAIAASCALLDALSSGTRSKSVGPTSCSSAAADAFTQQSYPSCATYFLSGVTFLVTTALCLIQGRIVMEAKFATSLSQICSHALSLRAHTQCLSGFHIVVYVLHMAAP
jgi:hypothetical protein